MKRNNFGLLTLLMVFLQINSIAQIWKAVSDLDFYKVGNGGPGVCAMIVDSATNTLIIGGQFDSIGNVQAKNIARWDGINFIPIGNGIDLGSGLYTIITSLAIYNNEIYAACNDYPAHKIFKWDGTNWSVFATPNDYTNCLKVHNGKLYAGGNFTVIGGTLVKGIGVYDGVSWSDIGGGGDDPNCGWCSFVEDIEFVDTLMYVGGTFATAGSAAVSNIAMWNGATWTALGSGINGNSGIYDGWVWSLKEYNNELYAGGNFEFAGGIPCHISKWNGTNWSLVGVGISTYASNFTIFKSKLYVTGGGYSGGNFISSPANWDGTNWNQTGAIPLGAGSPICVYNNELYNGIGWSFNGTDTIRVLARFGELEFQTQNSSCGNNCNGTATIADSVGVPLHTYLWSNGQTTRTATGLCPGVYTVSVTDGGGSVTEGSVTIGGPSAIQITAGAINASCGSCNDGSISLSLGGGTGSLSIQWSNGDTTNTITNLAFGNYSVTVTDSMGCFVANTYLVSYINSIQTQSTDVSCFSECAGNASATSNGVLPFVFEWSNGATTDSVLNLCEGVYYVTVTDSNGIAATDTVIITEPTQLVITDTITNASCAICNNGSISIGVIGGTGSLSIQWTNGYTTNSITNLAFSNYSVTVTDSMGCFVANTYLVSYINSIQTQSTDVSCFSECAGNASATSNGVLPFVFEWSNGATTDSVLNLCEGVYYVTVTDSNGIAATDTVIITEPTQLVITDTITNASCASCNDGTATINVIGGVPPISYLWNNGATTSTIDSLLFGIYTVTVTDNNGCVMIDSVTVGIDVGTGLQIVDYKLQIYPNPANETVTIILRQAQNDIEEVVFSNLLGVQMLKLPHTEYSNRNNSFEIDLSALATGVYFLKVQMSDGSIMVKKFVKQKDQ